MVRDDCEGPQFAALFRKERLGFCGEIDISDIAGRCQIAGWLSKDVILGLYRHSVSAADRHRAK